VNVEVNKNVDEFLHMVCFGIGVGARGSRLATRDSRFAD
jgi:hypothetical protein